MPYTIRQVSERTGLPVSTLRYYEAEQLLQPVRRNASHQREYGDQDLEWLSLITCLKNTGMPIQEIRRFVTLCSQGDVTLSERCHMLEAHRETTIRRIAQLNSELNHIQHKVTYYQEACRKAAEGCACKAEPAAGAKAPAKRVAQA